MVPVLCGSGGESGSLAKSIAEVTADVDEPIVVREGTDFMSMADEAKQLSAGLPDRKQQRLLGSAATRNSADPRRFPDS